MSAAIFFAVMLLIQNSGGGVGVSPQHREAEEVAIPIYPSIPPGELGQGEVIVEVAIDVAGKVTSVKAIKGPERLREAAEAAALKWRFRPTDVATSKFTLVFAFIMRSPFEKGTGIASVFKAPNRIELYEEHRDVVTIKDPAMTTSGKKKKF